MQQKLSWDVNEKPMVFNQVWRTSYVVRPGLTSLAIESFPTVLFAVVAFLHVASSVICVQDGPCWWCKLIQKAGYSMCLNAGTVLWYRHPHSDQVLLDWWQSTMDNYAENPLKRKFRTKWPWEQDRQMALYHRSPQHIQIASHPDFPMLIREHQDPTSVLYQAQAVERNQSAFDGATMLSDRDRKTNPSVVIKEWCLSHLPGHTHAIVVVHCFFSSTPFLSFFILARLPLHLLMNQSNHHFFYVLYVC